MQAFTARLSRKYYLVECLPGLDATTELRPASASSESGIHHDPDVEHSILDALADTDSIAE